MAHAEPRLAGGNDARLVAYPVLLAPGERFCQTGERVPPDAATLQLDAGTEGRPGPPLAVTVGARRSQVAGGYRDGPLTVPVPAGGGTPMTVCVRNEGDRRVFLAGQTNALAIPPGLAATVDGAPLPAVARTLYWRDGEESGWEIAGTVLDRWSRVTALGAVTPWLALGLFGIVVVAAVALAARGRAGPLACAAVATCAAAAWALTTPAFQVPDEPQHVAYAQYLAETGKVPRPVAGQVFSPEEGVVFAAVRFNHVFGNASGRPPWSADVSRQVDGALAEDPGSEPDGAGSNTTNNPPLYYGLQTIPLTVTQGGDFLDRLLAMRILSALLAGLTAAFTVLFLRELLPGRPWAWAAGALALAVHPLLGFISGGVNNDAALFAAGAALLWLIARAFRRGLDRSTAVGIGAAFGLGLIAKATMVAAAPGLLVVLAALLARAHGRERRGVLGLAALAAAVAAVPVAIYLLFNATVWDRPLWSNPPGTGPPAPGGPEPSLKGFVSYLWQFYLPRLPFMADQQAGLPLNQVWFKGFVGKFGWLDTMFPAAAYTIAVGIFAAVTALATRALWRARVSVRRRWPELAAYVALVIGFLLVIAWPGYNGRLDNGYVFEQTRYLLPLGALYAALIAAAALGAGRASARRWPSRSSCSRAGTLCCRPCSS